MQQDKQCPSSYMQRETLKEMGHEAKGCCPGPRTPHLSEAAAGELDDLKRPGALCCSCFHWLCPLP